MPTTATTPSTTPHSSRRSARRVHTRWYFTPDGGQRQRPAHRHAACRNAGRCARSHLLGIAERTWLIGTALLVVVIAIFYRGALAAFAPGPRGMEGARMEYVQHWRRGTHRVPAIILAIGLAGAALLAQAAPGAHGPDGEHLDDKADGKPSGLARLADGSVNVPKLAQRRMSIRTLIAGFHRGSADRRIAGRVVMDPNAGGRVQAATGEGRIEAGPNGLPAAGQAVQRAGACVCAFPRIRLRKPNKPGNAQNSNPRAPLPKSV